MNVLITGRGTSGSWNIRGEQLGQMIGATVRPRAESAQGHDAVVIVKRLHDRAFLRSARRHGVPVIWDIVDAWPQPKGDQWSREQSLSWLHQSVHAIQPDAVIASTQHMAHDITSIVSSGTPVITLAHHAWADKPINPIRAEVATIGYEGGEKHLGPWAQVLAEQARQRGWQFVVNPPSLADLDIVIALRREAGYAPRHWKSNVKLANAQASGTPIILGRESGYLETASGGEFWADTPGELSAGLDWFTDHAVRAEASRQMLGSEPKLQNIADDYRQWLLRVCECSTPRRPSSLSPARQLFGLAYSFLSDRLRR